MKWIFTMSLSHHHIRRYFSSFILSLQLFFDSGPLGSPSPPRYEHPSSATHLFLPCPSLSLFTFCESLLFTGVQEKPMDHQKPSHLSTPKWHFYVSVRVLWMYIASKWNWEFQVAWTEKENQIWYLVSLSIASCVHVASFPVQMNSSEDKKKEKGKIRPDGDVADFCYFPINDGDKHV